MQLSQCTKLALNSRGCLERHHASRIIVGVVDNFRCLKTIKYDADDGQIEKSM